MTFSLLQIAVISTSFFLTLLLAIWWHKKDKASETKESDVESFPVLMSVFFWSAFFALALKMLLDLVQYFAVEWQQMAWYFPTTIFLEDFVKVAALVIGLQIAGKRFNELSDGVIYAVFAALGFVFFENIFYVLAFAPNWQDFVLIFLGRNIFAFAAHLIIVVFGLMYATAYLKTSKTLLQKLKARKASRVKPYQICTLLKFLWNKYSFFTPFVIPFLPLILVVHLVRGKSSHLTMAEMLIGGFLLAFYLHLGYDVLLGLNIAWLNTLALSVVGIIGLIVYHFFPKLDIH